MMPTKSKSSAPAQEPYLKGKNAVLWFFICANLATCLSPAVRRISIALRSAALDTIGNAERVACS